VIGGPRSRSGPDGIDVDYAGSPGVVAQGLNVPHCYTEAYTSFGVKCFVAPKVDEAERVKLRMAVAAE